MPRIRRHSERCSAVANTPPDSANSRRFQGRVLQWRWHRRRRIGPHRFGRQLFLSARRGGAAHGRRRPDASGEGGGDAPQGVGSSARRDCPRAPPEVIRRRGHYERTGPADPHRRRAVRGRHLRDARRRARQGARIVSATVPESPGFVPAEWGYLVLDGGKVLGGSREQITRHQPSDGPRAPASSSPPAATGFGPRSSLLTAASRRSTCQCRPVFALPALFRRAI